MSRDDDFPRPSITEVFEAAGGQVFARTDGRGNQQSRCWAHEDASPSASVNEDEGIYHCFSCNRGGDVIELLKEVHGVDFLGAKRLAEELAGDGDSGVRKPARQSSGLLPGRSGSRPGRGNWSPPWRL